MWSCARGNLEASVMLYQWNHNALTMCNKQGMVPIQVAHHNSHTHIGSHLQCLEQQRQNNLINSCGNNGGKLLHSPVFAVPSNPVPVVSGKRPHSDVGSKGGNTMNRLSIDIPKPALDQQQQGVLSGQCSYPQQLPEGMVTTSPGELSQLDHSDYPSRYITKRSSIEVLPFSSLINTKSIPEQTTIRRDMENVKALSEPRHIIYQGGNEPKGLSDDRSSNMLSGGKPTFMAGDQSCVEIESSTDMQLGNTWNNDLEDFKFGNFEISDMETGK